MEDREYDHIRNYIVRCINDKDDETRLLISDFAILWNLYEDELYNKSHSIKKIPNVLSNLNIGNDGEKIIQLYNKLVIYISNKMEFKYDSIVRNYNILIKKPIIKNGEVQYYDAAKTRIMYTPGEIKEDILKRIMHGEDLKDRLYFLLVITARVRNNMFHGEKDISNLKNQKELFKICNETLKLVLDMRRNNI